MNKKYSFYDELHMSISQTGSQGVKIVLGDFNAKVRSERIGDVVGDHGLVVRNERIAKLKEWDQANDMLTKNT